jgi:hypothetical protein
MGPGQSAGAAGQGAPFALIERRRHVGPLLTVLLAAGLALLLTPIADAELWLGLTPPTVGARAGYSVRIPNHDAGRLVVSRGEVVTPAHAALLTTVRFPGRGSAELAGRAVAFTLVALLYGAFLRTSQRGRLLQVQLATFGALALVAAAAKALLLFSSVSALILPTGALAVLLAALVDRNAGIGAGVVVALLIAALTPFDATVGLVLCAQGTAASLALTHTRKKRHFMLAGLFGAAAAFVAYVGVHFLYHRALPFTELADPVHSPMVAALVGGLLVGPAAALCRPLVERGTGELSRSRLVELADLQQPLLRQIATQSPGTWQHSLAMANMAEVAANAIGANALLVRVGAYYHDLGKSLQPQYFIENLGPGDASPHDSLPPEVSADAIFSHVTEGVRVGRAQGLPEPIIDFMHMHHGDGVLEYFWSKCQEQGNPKRLSPRAFRYPGVPPQSRETAILCIVDAVEAAARSLKHPDAKAIEQLVQRIVYGKLHLGQLDESGLSVADLKILAATLVETLKHAHHVRIEYPWQKEAAKAPGAGVARPSNELTVPGTPEARQALAETQGVPRPARAQTQAHTSSALDSADAPRPFFDGVTGGFGAPSPPSAALATPPPGTITPLPGTLTQLGGAVTGPVVVEPAAAPEAEPVGAGADEPVPPPRRTTIELLKEEAAPSDAFAAETDMTPGTLILGAPPATHPEAITEAGPIGPSVAGDAGTSAATRPLTVVPAVPPASTPPPRRRRPPAAPK